MNINDLVCSLELAKKLKELGVKQKSNIYWMEIIDPFLVPILTEHDKLLFFHITHNILPPHVYSAFTSSELGEILPKAISIITDEEDKKMFCNFRFVTGRSLIIEEENPIEFWSVNYICDTTNEFRNWLFDALLTKAIYDKNEANARAKILIYLLENGLIKNG